MFCSQCGKKVSETMLFCPFCGAPIVIPDQDQPQKPEEQPEPIHLFDELKEEDAPEPFVPLDMENLTRSLWEDEPVPESKDEVEEEKPAPPKRPQPAAAPRPPKKRKAPNTYVPKREFDPNDIFLDGSDKEEEEDDFDEDYRYEEPEEGGFIVRHIRGLVTLALFVVVLAVVAGWLFSSSGQMALAGVRLAWSPSAYAGIAYQSYQAGSYAQAGSYYEEALERDSDNYDYANSAAVSYFMAQDTRRAEEMARKAIDIDPNRSEAYQLLARLYPDAASRTDEITQLLQQGYQRTGDESLNPS